MSFYRTSNGSEIDITPAHMFVMAPVSQGYPIKAGVTVVSLSELMQGIREIASQGITDAE